MTDRIAQLTKMLEADPADTFCLYSLAQEHARNGDCDEAIALYDRAIQADPTYCYAYFHKAKCQVEQDDESAAQQTLMQGLKHARESGQGKAEGEIAAFLDELN